MHSYRALFVESRHTDDHLCRHRRHYKIGLFSEAACILYAPFIPLQLS
jgi:hypothetical protein